MIDNRNGWESFLHYEQYWRAIRAYGYRPLSFAEFAINQQLFGHEMTSDRLSRCASAISRELRSSAEAYDEISVMHAPSECCGLVARSERRAIERVLSEYGYTAQQFVDELTERTSSAYVYFSGFAQLADMFNVDY